MNCSCELHHEDEPCTKPIVWAVSVEYPDGKGQQVVSCVHCLSAVAQSLVSGVDLPLTIRELG
jgi:hypothetical protein